MAQEQLPKDEYFSVRRLARRQRLPVCRKTATLKFGLEDADVAPGTSVGQSQIYGIFFACSVCHRRGGTRVCRGELTLLVPIAVSVMMVLHSLPLSLCIFPYNLRALSTALTPPHVVVECDSLVVLQRPPPLPREERCPAVTNVPVEASSEGPSLANTRVPVKPRSYPSLRASTDRSVHVKADACGRRGV